MSRRSRRWRLLSREDPCTAQEATLAQNNKNSIAVSHANNLQFLPSSKPSLDSQLPHKPKMSPAAFSPQSCYLSITVKPDCTQCAGNVMLTAA